MRRPTLAFVLLTTLTALSMPFASAAIQQPEPTLGDFWEIRAVLQDGQGGETPSASSRNTVTAFETITINGTEYEAVRTEQFNNQSSNDGDAAFTTSSHLTSWTRRSDGAALRTRSVFSYSGLGLPASETTTETTYLEPCRHLAFPFDVGSSWEVSCRSTSTTSASFPGQPAPADTTTNETYRIRVLRAERVTVPAGSFDAVVVEFNATSESFTYYQWYAPEACSFVRSSADPEGTNVTSELVSFRCAEGGGSSTISTPATPASTPATPASTPATPPATGATPATPTGATPTGATPTGAAPTGGTEGNTSGTPTDVPGPGVLALAIAGGVAALVLRRKAS